MQSRYLEAAINGVLVACLYLPNGNPRPGPKFDYKMRWFDRLIDHAATLHATGAPVSADPLLRATEAALERK